MKFSTVCAFVVVVVLAVVVMLIIWSNNNSLLSLQCMKRLKHSQDNAKKTPATPPADCVILGHACDCPVSSWAAASVSRETACAMLQDRTVFFAGDSLSRDLWSSAGAWLLDEEIRTMKHAGHLNHNQACMLCAWKFAPDVWDELRSRRLLTEVLTVHKSVSTIHACKRGRTKLVFKYARLGELPQCGDRHRLAVLFPMSFAQSKLKFLQSMSCVAGTFQPDRRNASRLRQDQGRNTWL